MEAEQRYEILQRARLKTLFKRLLLVLLVGVLSYYTIAVVYYTKTIYKVRRNYAVILEDLSGERRVIDDIGWHARLPFFTRLELEVPLMNQEMFLNGAAEPQRMMSKGNIALWTSAMLTFRITDLQRWGIENRSPQVLLQNDFDGIVKDVIQGHQVDDLISERERIKEETYLALKERPINAGGLNLEEKYGIEVVSFVLRDTRFGEKLAAASEEKKRRELIAEAENYAADQEASRIRKLYQAYSLSINDFRKELGLGAHSDRYLFDFLNQQKWATAYEKNQQGQNTFVINSTGADPAVVLPSPSGRQAGKPAENGD
ncbi:MAG: SPFH domain-containing protein [Desulfuromonas sp.]|nr:MAG: SPFH domain-containing protein [Desulfuromonas sp.]